MNRFSPVDRIYPCVHEHKIEEYFSSLVDGGAGRPALGPRMKIKCRSSYFICFTNRCGSNFLGSAIASDGRLKAAGEFLNYPYVINQSRRRGAKNFAHYMRWLANHNKGSTGVFGCKASVGQLMYLYDLGLLNKIGEEQKFIHIMRRDVIGQAVSLFIASKTGGWTSKHEARETQIDYCSKHLVKLVQNINIQNAMFSSFFSLINVQPMVIYYEDLVASPSDYISKVGEFVGVDGLTYVQEKIEYHKQSNDLNSNFKRKLLEDYSL